MVPLQYNVRCGNSLFVHTIFERERVLARAVGGCRGSSAFRLGYRGRFWTVPLELLGMGQEQVFSRPKRANYAISLRAQSATHTLEYGKTGQSARHADNDFWVCEKCVDCSYARLRGWSD